MYQTFLKWSKLSYNCKIRTPKSLKIMWWGLISHFLPWWRGVIDTLIRINLGTFDCFQRPKTFQKWCKLTLIVRYRHKVSKNRVVVPDFTFFCIGGEWVICTFIMTNRSTFDCLLKSQTFLNWSKMSYNCKRQTQRV